jgi:hypothetical protein
MYNFVYVVELFLTRRKPVGSPDGTSIDPPEGMSWV